MYKTILLEDEPRAMRVLQHQLKAHPELEIVEACETIPQAHEAILHHQPELIFLDIRVNSKLVFPLVKDIWESGLTPAIIFVTAWGKQYLDDAMAACGQLFQWSYLTKPVEDEKLAEVVGRFLAVKAQAALREEESPSMGKLAIRTGRNIRLVNFEHIVYCESNGNYVNIHLLHERELVKRVWSGSMVRLMADELPSELFYRTTSKIIINRKYLKGAADNRQYCVLGSDEMPKEVRLWVSERERKRVWKDLL